MKKWLSVILLLAITLGLCACGGEGSGETAPAEGLKIGYARESILPEGQVNMSGGGNQAQRVSTGYLDILYATCLAITENGTTILLYSTDTLCSKSKWTAEARKLISEATGVCRKPISRSAAPTPTPALPLAVASRWFCSGSPFTWTHW